ncbi:DUF3231 family protein [Alkalihalobacillus sp. LMS39]|uniref:DUF3231 family protein n=1 Tax=Alkalihalobacillus sp. LMS39 TaxID=2924032 RepID=UPI001FB2A846|nr:DUF3231 family protein [Alkalihalobacillus sp. LMS39]UOE95179.1 DUF3231 family protein [Alkalihalobacillus sp. LMS39]
MTQHNARLSSAEIAVLWETYMLDSISICFMQHLKQHLKNAEIKPLLIKALNLSKLHIQEIEQIFKKEQFPIPHAFSEKDVDLTAPKLFHDEFSLSFIYAMNRMALINYSFITTSVAREDISKFVTSCLKESADLFNESRDLMLEKGIYDRPPMINYPSKVEFIESDSFISGYISKNRKLNSTEMKEIFLNIERNYFGSLLCKAILQVVKDKEIKKYIENGKDISDKQIKFFNELLVKEDLLGTVPTALLVTNSTTSPFSERLLMQLFASLNRIDITLIGHALSLSMRSDIQLYLSKLIPEILKYSKDGFDIAVKRKWIEQNP